MNLRTMAFAAIALVAFGTSAVSFAQTSPGPQSTPPPPPVPNAQPSSSPLISSSAQPTALPSDATPPTSAPTQPAPSTTTATPAAPAADSPSPGGKRGRRGGNPAPAPGPSPTDTPEAPQFSTLDGVWEVAFQPLTGARTKYSHLYVTQTGNDLKGTWRDGKTVMPFTGTFDGRLLKLTAMSGASTFIFSGYEENFMDMVGLFTDGDPKHQGTPFTAAHRKRERDRDVNVK